MNLITNEQTKAIGALMRDCGAFILGAHSVETHTGEITEKPGSANFVTVYDVAVQNRLVEGLKKLFPGANFLAEEDKTPAAMPETGYCFVIDPIDGTTNFIHDMRCSGVSVALFYNREPLFGAVLDPYRDELFTAVQGETAYLNDRPIAVSNRDMSHALVSFGTSPYDREATCEQSFSIVKNVLLRCADIRRSGSAAVDICFVACGRSDGFFEAILSPWDFAAGGIILAAAGGKMTDFSGSPIAPGKKSSVLCTNGNLHGEMLDLINKN